MKDLMKKTAVESLVLAPGMNQKPHVQIEDFDVPYFEKGKEYMMYLNELDKVHEIDFRVPDRGLKWEYFGYTLYQFYNINNIGQFLIEGFLIDDSDIYVLGLSLEL